MQRLLRILRYVSCLIASMLVGMALLAPGAALADGPSPLDPTLPVTQFRAEFPDVAGLNKGVVVDQRSISVAWSPTLTAPAAGATQFWVASSDNQGRPAPILATLLIPVGWNQTLVANNVAIDGLGLDCNPSATVPGESNQPPSLELPDATNQLLQHHYAVVLVDYQGRHMAYADGPTEGPAVLDGVRGAVSILRSTYHLAKVPVAMMGYSGGAIASVWAAQMQPWYAPDIDLIGVVSGGTPVDLSEVTATMSGGIGNGLLFGGSFGVGRAYPGALAVLQGNPIGSALANWFKDQCTTSLIIAGAASSIIGMNLDMLTFTGILVTPMVKEIFTETKVGQQVPGAPLLMEHGLGDEFIPYGPAKAYAHEMCAHGAQVSFRDLDVQVGTFQVPTEHLTGAFPFTTDALNQIHSWVSGGHLSSVCNF